MIRIMSHAECMKFLLGNKRDSNQCSQLMEDDAGETEAYVICITSPGEEVPGPILENAADLLQLEFDDADFDGDGTVATEQDITDALRFARNFEDLIVCCERGISRSAALAYVIECSRVKHPALACGLWDKKRHHPSRRIIGLGEQLLQNTEIGKQYTKWMTK